MAFFDSFFSEKKQKQTPQQPAKPSQSGFGFSGQPASAPQGFNNSALGMYSPQSFEDLKVVIEALKVNKPVIVNTKGLNNETTQRVVDILSGALFALGGEISPISEGLYALTINEK